MPPREGGYRRTGAASAEARAYPGVVENPPRGGGCSTTGEEGTPTTWRLPEARLVCAGSGRVVGIEVKTSRTVKAEQFRGLRALHELAGERFVQGVLLHPGAESIPFGDRLSSAPMSALWSARPKRGRA